MTVSDLASLQEAARSDAANARGRAGVEVRALKKPREMVDAASLFARVWPEAMAGAPSGWAGMFTALAHAGNFLAGAFADDALVAVSCGFFYEPDVRALHSHITGVLDSHAGKGVGTAVKLYQRAWCLERGIERVTWTYDPLIARNAHFNICNLGGRVSQYASDFYPGLAGGPDRVFVEWDITHRHRSRRAPSSGDSAPSCLEVGSDDSPVPVRLQPGLSRCAIGIPEDIESLRAGRPAVAKSWSAAVRETLGGLLANGWRVVDFDAARRYVLEAPGITQST